MNEEQPNYITADRLIRLEKCVGKPHVVILGAGASLAAFPKGDANGRPLPIMATLVETLGLRDELVAAGCDPAGDFEVMYSHLHQATPNSPLLKRIETDVQSYFDSLVLPNQITLYDLLLLSLQEKDAIFTFNWDPFLADAYSRHAHRGIRLPQIFHLHGNVRVSFCEHCGTAMRRIQRCPTCHTLLIPSPLLYPIQQKDYASDICIRTQWDQVKDYLKDAFHVTVFGYRAPQTDQEAISVLTTPSMK